MSIIEPTVRYWRLRIWFGHLQDFSAFEPCDVVTLLGL